MKALQASDFIAAPAADDRRAEPARASAVRIETVAITAIPPEWDDAWDSLATEAAEPNAFAERWFMRPSIAHLARAKDMRMLAAWRGDDLIGLLPLIIAAHYGRLAVRHVQNWLHFHSFLGTPLVRKGQEAAFWSAILDTLDRADWAPGFLHINGLVADGPLHNALRNTRRADIVWRVERALLESNLAPDAYYEQVVRKKKRKEINRLNARLCELGEVRFTAFDGRGDLTEWCDSFLALEASGWKGRAGSALASKPQTERFFREAVAGAYAAGRLEFLRLELNDRPIAMLVNFMTSPGSFSFKIAFDEEYARFSPGVLIQRENLRVLERKDVAWMDSCAVENHPMINSLWAERRAIVRVTVPLGGWRRRLTFAACRFAETLYARLKRVKPAPATEEA